MASRSGFTLVEMLMVMVLISVLAGIVAFSGGTSLAWRTFNRDATGIYSVCRHARAMSIAQSKKVRVEIDAAARSYKLTIQDNPDTDETFAAAPGSWSEIFYYDERVTVTLTDRLAGGEAPLYVTFNPDGTADPVDIELTHDAFKEKMRISVSDLTAIPSLEVIDEEN